jgi:hypothetical protein
LAESWNDRARAVSEDFILAAHSKRHRDIDALVDLIASETMSDQEAHARIHMLSAAGAIITGSVARACSGDRDLSSEPAGVYGFEIDNLENGPVRPEQLLAARLLTAGANLDLPHVQALVRSACEIATGTHACDFLTTALLELMDIFNALTPPNVTALQWPLPTTGDPA